MFQHAKNSGIYQAKTVSMEKFFFSLMGIVLVLMVWLCILMTVELTWGAYTFFFN